MGRAIGAVCYARKSGDAYSLDGPDGHAGVVLMQRSDFVVAFVELPRGAQESAREYLSYRVRGLYPAPAEETAFDYRLLRAGGGLQAIVFVTRREVLERYRALGRPLALPFSLMAASIPNLVAEGGAFVFVHPQWLEASLLPGRKHKPPPRSLLVPRADSLAEDLASALDELEPGELPLRIVAAAAEAAAVREAIAGDAALRRASVHELAAEPARAALFGPEAKPVRVPWGLRFQALLLLILALGTLTFVRSAWRDQAAATAAEGRLKGLRAQVVGAASDRKRVEALTKELAGLEARRPVDVYRLLSQLSRVLGGDVRVASLIVDGRLFQVEAEGRAALELVEKLRADPWFESVRLLQIVPSPTAAGQERFRLTGAYRAQ